MLQSPAELLQPEWIAIIRNAAPEAERQGLLLPEQLELIYRQQWFKLLTPAVYGGPETPLPDLVRLEESLAWADGSLAWVVTLCCGAGWFSGFLQPELARQIFSSPQACLAGSGAATGTATETKGGYLINGAWKYASGAHHATHFTANCIMEKDGQTVPAPSGEPLIVPFVIPAEQVTLSATWKYVGMMGTGSQAFEVKNAVVPALNAFKIAPDAAVVNGPLYTYPFLQLAEATLAANLSGMALRFVELCEPVFTERMKQPKITAPQQTQLQAELKNAQHMLQQKRNDFYAALDASWQLPAEPALLKAVSAASRQLALAARECTDRLYPYCGLQAASPDAEINQVWRNLHTASQHSLLTFEE